MATSKRPSSEQRPLAVVIGASTGIGYELARCCARAEFDLVIAADEPKIHDAADDIRSHGVDVIAVEADLATPEGVGNFMMPSKADAFRRFLQMQAAVSATDFSIKSLSM